MDSAPEVTILMNAYNSADYLQETLDTVKLQTFGDYEIVFWDNASTDATGQIAQSFGDRLRYFRAEQTTPLGEARNQALQQVRSPLVAFLDCDDLWEPDKLALQVELFRKNERVGLVCTDTIMFDGKRDLNRVFDGSTPARGHVFAELIQRQWISMSSSMIRMSALRALSEWFDPQLSLCEEADVFYRIAKDWELDYVNAPLTRWRVHGVNTTFRKFDSFGFETAHILDKFRNLYPGFEQDYAELDCLLLNRAAFQQSVALWHQCRGAEARAKLKECRSTPKTKLFGLITYFPGSLFDTFARLYFMLPAFLRKA